MTSACKMLEGAFAALRQEFQCTPSADARTVLVSTGRFYADGDAVEVLVRFSEDGTRAAVSDGGLTRVRRDMFTAGEMSRGAAALWRDVIADFGVTEIDDRIYVRGTAASVAQMIAQIADTSLTLDSVKLLIEQERVTFATKLERWLRQEANVEVADNKVVPNRYGEPQLVTAIVGGSNRLVAVQGAGGHSASAVRSSAEHAHWVFSGLGDDWPIQNRLVVLERVDSRRHETVTSLVSRLKEVAYVASFERQISLRRFLVESPPVDRDLVTVPFGQAFLES